MLIGTLFSEDRIFLPPLSPRNIFLNYFKCPKRTRLCKSLEFSFCSLSEKRLEGTFNFWDLQPSRNGGPVKTSPLLKSVNCSGVYLREMRPRVEKKRKKDLQGLGQAFSGSGRPHTSELSVSVISRSPACLNFNLRGARGNHPFKPTAHLCGFTCAYWIWRLLFPHLHDNRGLKRFTQSEFWADKCQANISFLFFSRVVGNVDFWAKSWILL